MAGPSSEPPGFGPAPEEFFSEAQEIIDQLAKDLWEITDGLKRGATTPEPLNDLFRGAHTLKGLAGLFGFDRLSRLTHLLEDQLDELRLGRLKLSDAQLDLFFQGVELIGRLLVAARNTGRDEDEGFDAFIARLQSPDPRVEVPGELADYELDESVVSVLTEYEEHRLKTNIAQGLPLYRVRGRYPLATIDKSFEEVRSKAQQLGELIATSPTGESDADSLELEMLVASSTPLEQLRSRLEGPGVTVLEVPRKRKGRATIHAENPKAVSKPSSAGGRSQNAREANETPAPKTHSFRAEAEKIPAPPKLPEGLEPVRGTDEHADPLGLDGPFAKPMKSSSSAEMAVNGNGAVGEPKRNTPVAPAPEEPEENADARVHTVRVDIRRLDHLMNMLGELAIVRGSLARLMERLRQVPGVRGFSMELHRLHRAFERNLEEMQTGILEVRMVPLGQIFPHVASSARLEARKAGKPVRVVITGSETEVDKLIVEKLKSPLIHIARNAIAHGIEDEAMRTEHGKPREGTIAMNAYQAGNHVVIEIEDDGGGIDETKVLQRAVARGIVRTEEVRELSRADLLNLIFLPGFSTSDEVTDLAGRGVGLDEVKTKINGLGGVVDVTSEPGIGTKFTITLPITLAILRALLLDVAGRQYALPLASVAVAMVLEHSKIKTVEGREVYSQRGETLPLCRLDRLFGHGRPMGDPPRQFIVVVAMGGRRVGLVVDQLFGQQDIVIKALGPSLAHVKGFAGATDLGDQRVGLVLDAGALLEEILTGGPGQDRRRFEVHGGKYA